MIVLSIEKFTKDYFKRIFRSRTALEGEEQGKAKVKMGIFSSKADSRAAAQTTKVNHTQKKASISSADKVKLQLKMQRDNLRAAIKKYELVGNFERQKAKDLLKAGDKRRALYCLKCGKIQESRIAKLAVMYDNIENVIETLQMKEVEIEVFQSLKTGQVELEKLNSMLRIEEIEKLMSETAESIEEARQIDEILAQPIDDKYVDEDELLQMLRGDETIEEQIVKVQSIKVPKVDASKVPSSAQDERVMLSV